mmetsp:Transcript_13879/g.43690  ORF Transcript_13879/g.43690 Transcript_13879/m.43690 type:complete len:177 (-) Transcript_13879:42-572(-)|eukprot:CAMPEP_0170733724 /NCGR_PEP_ID=MMETSP0437-20130122/2221_1 /TAXON_ID=0 /ORGANISM="Sexangularia sp." /LENGTH=176 /DNA_ID=CAMNT_0011072013 /DNA_START=40 /DNA_END=570 /DNA_ORIENTATION=+
MVAERTARGRSPGRKKATVTAKTGATGTAAKTATATEKTTSKSSDDSVAASKSDRDARRADGDDGRTGFFWTTPRFLLSPWFYLLLAVLAGILSVTIPTMDQFDAPMATVAMLGQASGAPNEYGTFGIFALARTAGVRGGADYLWFGAAHRWFPLSKAVSARILPFWFKYKPFITV